MRRARNEKALPRAEGLGLLELASRDRTRVNPSGRTSCGRAGAFACHWRSDEGSWRFSQRYPAPASERRPQAAVQAEAVDRCRRLDRADAIEADAGPLEAALLQHAARGRVAHPRAAQQK